MLRLLLILCGCLGLSQSKPQNVQTLPAVSSGQLPSVQSGVPASGFSSLPSGGWTRPSWPSSSYGSTQYMGPKIQVLPDNSGGLTRPWTGYGTNINKPYTPYSSGPISTMTKPYTPYSSGPISGMTKPWTGSYNPKSWISHQPSYQYPSSIRYPSTGSGCSSGGCSSSYSAPSYSRPMSYSSTSLCGSSSSASKSYGPIMSSLTGCGGSGFNTGYGWQKPVVSSSYYNTGSSNIKTVSSAASKKGCGGCGK